MHPPLLLLHSVNTNSQQPPHDLKDELIKDTRLWFCVKKSRFFQRKDDSKNSLDKKKIMRSRFFGLSFFFFFSQQLPERQHSNQAVSISSWFLWRLHLHRQQWRQHKCVHNANLPPPSVSSQCFKCCFFFLPLLDTFTSVSHQHSVRVSWIFTDRLHVQSVYIRSSASCLQVRAASSDQQTHQCYSWLHNGD